MNTTYKSTDIAKLILTITGCDGMDKTKLHKLLYYIQGWSLAGLGRPAFTNDLEAWMNGPVSTGMRSDTADKPCWKVVQIPLDDQMAASDGELVSLIQLIAPFYAEKSTQQLIDDTHSEDPWLHARQGIPEGGYGDQPISDDALCTFFSNNVSVFGLTPSDIELFGVDSFLKSEEAYTNADDDNEPQSHLDQSANLFHFTSTPL